MSALQLANCAVTCMNFLFTSAPTVRSFTADSWAGLRASQMKAIGASSSMNAVMATVGSISWVTEPTAWSAMQSDAVGSISPAQLPLIAPAVFSAFPVEYLSAEAVPALTTAQMQQVPATTYAGLSCPEFLALTPAQRETLASVSYETEQQLQGKCGLAVSSTAVAVSSTASISSTGSSGSSTGSTESSTGSADSSTGAGPPPGEPSKGMSKGELAGIIVGSVVGFALIVGLIIYCCRRNRVDPNAPFDPLNPRQKLIPNQRSYD
jgi:hypothetical protein